VSGFGDEVPFVNAIKSPGTTNRLFPLPDDYRGQALRQDKAIPRSFVHSSFYFLDLTWGKYKCRGIKETHRTIVVFIIKSMKPHNNTTPPLGTCKLATAHQSDANDTIPNKSSQ
jgi:hypothetical protein